MHRYRPVTDLQELATVQPGEALWGARAVMYAIAAQSANGKCLFGQAHGRGEQTAYGDGGDKISNYCDHGYYLGNATRQRVRLVRNNHRYLRCCRCPENGSFCSRWRARVHATTRQSCLVPPIQSWARRGSDQPTQPVQPRVTYGPATNFATSTTTIQSSRRRCAPSTSPTPRDQVRHGLP